MNNKFQNILLLISTICTIFVFVIFLTLAIIILPRVTNIFDQVDTILTDLNSITEEIEEANIPKLIDNTNRLVIESENSINKATNKINDIDIDGLNESIESLRTTTEKFSKLFKK